MVAKNLTEEDAESNSSDEKLEDDDKPPDRDLPKVETEPAGLTVQGDWEEITNFCAYFNYTIQKESTKEEISAEKLKGWEEWYPRKGEDRDKLEEKSASQAAFQPNKSPEKKLNRSVDHLNHSKQNFQNGEHKEGAQQLASASARLLDGLFTFLGKGLGNLEGFIYRTIITKTNSVYFDSSLLSVNLEKKSKLGRKGKDYEVQIKVHDDNLRKRMRDKLPQ